jgi:peptidoglycan hydrolase-like protein with peptidoglycan-binding domain
MAGKIPTGLLIAGLLIAAGFSAPVVADELTQRIQKDLATLGYSPGNVNGEMSDTTVAAIAQFQAERSMPVTGEVSPLLAGIISAEVSKKGAATATPAPSAAAATPAAAQDPAALQAAQQACLQAKVDQAQASNKKKQGFGRLLSAVTRTASQSGNYDLARTTSNVYSASATADDLSAAAKDLGLTEDDVAACQNPT